MLREDHSVSKRCQRPCPRWPFSQITQNTVVYVTVRDRSYSSIPSLYCGAKYCRSGLKSDFQLLKTEPGKETKSRPGPFGMLGKLL